MKAIRFHSKFHRIAGAAFAASVFFFAVMTVVWTVANTSAIAAGEKEVAELLTKLSPGDPQTHLASAKLHEKAFDAADLKIALKEYEEAAGRSPNNYVHWLLLGSARTRAGDDAGAEAAFRRASELAPSYSRVHWALGNLLLRQGRDDEGFDQIRHALAGDPSLSAPTATIALQLEGGNAQIVQERFSDFPEVEVRLATLLVEQKGYDDAANVWRQITIPKGSDRFDEAAKQLAHKAFEAKHFRLAAEVTATAPTSTPQLTVGSTTNSGFEMPVKAQYAGLFDWRVPQSNNPQFALTDAQKRSGQYSLLAILNSADPNTFQGISQIVAVEPGRSYGLTIAYRAEAKTKAEYEWEVVSLADGKTIAGSNTLLTLTDWTAINIDFAVPLSTDGIEIRLVRGPCAGAGCSASGSLWFDEIVLTAK